ncbi:MAG: type II toxin-antitoxin system YafQ family toxin [Alphaproteobacteria bacterium]|nr:type II toxin-antitoxin system YafQ family toxin [Alphaproteobacteria bacterium]
MKDIVQSGAFMRDIRRAAKRGKDLSKLYKVVEHLAKGETLTPKHKPHPLRGEWKPKWDCHIEPDWLLIYQVTDDAVLLARTGTHADLFG